MRVALICDWYEPRRGGIEAHLSGLGARLTGAGHDVQIITSTPGPSLVDGLNVHRLPGALLPKAGVAYTRKTVRSIGDILVSEHIELAHAHVSIVAPVGLGGAHQAQQAGVPTVVTFHSFIPGTRVWARIVGRAMGTSGWNAILTAVSSRVAHEIQPFAPGETVMILPNAVDVAFWTPGEPRLPDAPVALIYVGRLQSKKRPMLALHAARRLRESFPSLAFTLRIVGAGPLERRMRNYVETHGLGERVEFLGWKDKAAVRDLLRASDIFLSTAERESFGLAALEARCVGVSVVGIARSAVSDFIDDGRSGLLGTSDEEFIAAVVQLASDTTRRHAIIGHNRRVVSNLDWSHTLALHQKAYARAVGLATPGTSA